jgi:hypothetical protein
LRFRFCRIFPGDQADNLGIIRQAQPDRPVIIIKGAVPVA